MTRAGVVASLAEEEVRRCDRELESLLASRFPEDPLEVPHRVWVVISPPECGHPRKKLTG